MTLRWDAVTVDSLDAERLAAFWAGLLEVEVQGRWEQYVVLRSDAPGRPRLMFQPVTSKPERTVMHLDLHAPPDRFDLEVARAVSLGAAIVETQEQDGQHWQVMTDPEGNVFCIVRD